MTNWWTYNIDQQFGQVMDREGPFLKPDANIYAPANTAFTAILPGTVTGIDTTSSWGETVTVRLDNPINSVATHYSFLHLQSIAPGLYVGEHVNSGSLLGFGGGDQSISGADPGFALTASDNYGYGKGWSDNVTSNWINPLLNPNQIISDLKNGTLEQQSFQQSSSGSGKGIFSLLGQNFGPTSGQLQQFMFVSFGFTVILVGILVIFFSSKTGKEATKVGIEAATL